MTRKTIQKSNYFFFNGFLCKTPLSESLIDFSLDDVKLLIQLINTESRRLSKIEAKLCDQCSAIEDNSILKLSNNIENLLFEIEVRNLKINKILE